MKRILTLFTLTLFFTLTLAEELTVKSFQLAYNDLTASTQRRNDVNGQACALVKVYLAQEGASFTGDVVGSTSFSQSEYHVYMENGSKNLLIRIDGYKPLNVVFSDYGIISLDGLSTYKLVLVLSHSQTSSSLKACPDNHHPHAIDLGLPSGTKWACCNVGATMPEDNGDFYAWGEISSKNTYEESNYVYSAGKDKFKNIGNNIANTKYDVASVKQGSTWQMPSQVQIQELMKKCKMTWTQQQGKKGIKVTGPNGGVIFLPAVGYFAYEKIERVGIYGHYWSSSLSSISDGNAFYLGFDSELDIWYCDTDQDYNRFLGYSVRAVCK